MTDAVELIRVHKAFVNRRRSKEVFGGFSLKVVEGDSLAIMGESGSGKSTLLNILGLIDDDYSGEYKLFGNKVASWSSKEKARVRNRDIGFVLQEASLIPVLSIEKNIMLPALYSCGVAEGFSRRLEELARRLGIEDVLRELPANCSGGQRARAAIARAVLLNPKLILADEPTASLDRANAMRVMELLFEMKEIYGATLISVTHDRSFANDHDKIILIKERSQ